MLCGPVSLRVVCPSVYVLISSVIRHLKAGLGVGPYNTRDKFRIDVCYDKRVIGRKLVPATLVEATKEVAEDCSLL